MTELGALLNFPVGSFKYLSPEELLSINKQSEMPNIKGDVWSLGVILLELSLVCTSNCSVYVYTTSA